MLDMLLIQEAWRLATGGDVHNVNKAVACYQRYDREHPVPLQVAEPPEDTGHLGTVAPGVCSEEETG